MLAYPRAIIFDWDNTLVDSWPVIMDALNTTYRAFGLREWTLEETRNNVRESLRDRFPRIFGDVWEKAADLFYARYAEIHADAVLPAAGAGELLADLAGRGIYLGVVSNKTGSFLREEAERLGWARHFGAIIGALDAERDKPDPAPVAMALRPGGLVSGPDIWFAGDTDIDMVCAANAGCTPVLIRAEAPKTDEFQGAQPFRHFSSCTELSKFVASM